MTTDWAALRIAAVGAARNAHAPYSTLHVGAAGVTSSGAVVTGCNVENASFGLTLCAECGLVSDLCRIGESRLVAVSVVDGEGLPVMPCGRCRQLLWEHGGGAILIDAEPAPRPLADLLPEVFGLDASANAHTESHP